MGSPIELNDTLKLKRGAGFPADVREGDVHRFSIKGRRIYNLSPSRVFLVEEIDGKWNYVGHAMILAQSIDAQADRTLGEFRITKVYPRDYAAMANLIEAPPGKGFEDNSATVVRLASVA